VTAVEAARILGITTAIVKDPQTAIRTMVRKGDLRGRKVGKTIMVVRASLDEYASVSTLGRIPPVSEVD
jgi:hypothetical protein